MQSTFKFEVVTPTGVFYQDDVNFISFDALDGEMGILANHAPVLVANKPGMLKIVKDNNTNFAYISEGFLEITEEKVSAIVDLADWAQDISAEEAIKAKRIAEEALESERFDFGRQAELKASIERASARIRVAGLK